jgi:hypothetical protein
VGDIALANVVASAQSHAAMRAEPKGGNALLEVNTLSIPSAKAPARERVP